MLKTLLLAFVLIGCRSDDPGPARALLRNLTRVGDPAPPDTAAQRADSQFQACVYVYETPERIRECLVVQDHWSAQDAARRIAIYQAQVGKSIDSLRRVWDSLEVVRRRNQDSLDLARRRSRDHLDGPPMRTYPDSGAWMADNRTRGFYRTTCAAARQIPVKHRVYFTTREDAEAAGLWRSAQPGCQGESYRHFWQAKKAAINRRVREAMHWIERRLDPATFVRIHRSFIVNAEHIRDLRTRPNGDRVVVLKGGQALPISRRRRAAAERVLLGVLE